MIHHYAVMVLMMCSPVPDLLTHAPQPVSEPSAPVVSDWERKGFSLTIYSCHLDWFSAAQSPCVNFILKVRSTAFKRFSRVLTFFCHLAEKWSKLKYQYQSQRCPWAIMANECGIERMIWLLLDKLNRFLVKKKKR